MEYAFFLGLMFVLGLAFGSFGNVVIWRLPRGESLSHPASHCPRCETPIRWYDNIPVVSWLILRARCRACGEPISARYPAVEFTSALLFVLAGVTWGVSAKAVTGAAFFYCLLLLSLIDWDTMRLPDRLVAPLALFGLTAASLAQFSSIEAAPLVGAESGVFAQPLVGALAGLLLGGGLSLLVAEVYSRVRGVDGFGGGDIKLLGTMGLFLGPYVLFALFAGSLLGAVYGIVVAARGSEEGRHTKFPFGPFLAIGGVLAATIGPALWAWYVTLVTGP